MEKILQHTKKLKFFDIAANLADQQFQGTYHGKKYHSDDTDHVITRAQQFGCDRLLIVGGYLQDAIESYQLCQKSPLFKCTIGVHPCHVSKVEKDCTQEEYFLKIENFLNEKKDKCVAIGECGLDYDRIEFQNPKELQIKHFLPHFELACKYSLPMYLHNRNTGNDFFDILKSNRHKFSEGVVHSFTGNQEEMQQILGLSLYIGINGCSLKSQENIDVVKQIPMDRLLLETDSPYCEIRNTHVGIQSVKTKFESIKKEKHSIDKLVRGRNEPCQIIQVCEVVAGLKNMTVEEVSQIAYQNSLKLFNLKEDIEN